MALFTLVLDYKGGTYVSQTACRGIQDLPSVLGRALDWRGLANPVSDRARQRFLKDVEENPPVEVEGLRNVWCVAARLGDALAILHVMETAQISPMAVEETPGS